MSSFACFQILLQKRAACKDSFPGCWDVSCAGHLAAGETAESAAIAELAEELGIVKPPDVEFSQFFHQLPTMFRTVISQAGKFIDNEVTYIYYLEGDWKASEMVLQEEEVEAVDWMEMDELIQNLAQKVRQALSDTGRAKDDWQMQSLTLCSSLRLLTRRIRSSSISRIWTPTRKRCFNHSSNGRRRFVRAKERQRSP